MSVRTRVLAVALFLFATSLHAAEIEIAPERAVIEPITGESGSIGTDGKGYLTVWYSSGKWRVRRLGSDARPVGPEIHPYLGYRPHGRIVGSGTVWFVGGVLIHDDRIVYTGVHGFAVSDGDGFLVHSHHATIVKPDGQTISIPRIALPGDYLVLTGKSY